MKEELRKVVLGQDSFEVDQQGEYWNGRVVSNRIECVERDCLS